MEIQKDNAPNRDLARSYENGKLHPKVLIADFSGLKRQKSKIHPFNKSMKVDLINLAKNKSLNQSLKKSICII